MKIEIHLLQNFAPSCLNRDDANTPKTCTFGGVSRARVSSQSWKRAVRDTFRHENSIPTGIRTKQLAAKLLERLGDGFEEAKVIKFLEETYSKMDGKRKQETAVLLFMSEAEIVEAAACIREGLSGDKAAPRLKAAQRSADVALFGRMLAEKPEFNIDAACQVAHAISTHQADFETDFYTAVDDLTRDRDEVGAGMLGTQGFNSACFYRYALVDYKELVANLGGDRILAETALQEFLRSFTLTVPTAKQNSHAAQNRPSFGLFVARKSGTPVSLANAFALPIRSEDLIGASIYALVRHHARLDKVYGIYKDATQAIFHDRESDKPLGDLAAYDAETLDQAIKSIIGAVHV